MSNIIYHYCSVNTFLSIIQSKTLRFYDIDKSNDFLERKLWCECVKKSVNPMIETMRKIEGKIPEKYFQRAISDLSSVKIQADDLIEQYKAYVICFSQIGDLLSQWRGYADDGQGISIGFDDEVFTEYTKVMKTIFKYDKIEYIPLPNGEPDNGVSNQDIQYKNVFVKNEAFSEEQEWRAVIYSEPKNIMSFVNLLKSMVQGEENSLKFKELQFSSDGKEIRSFIEVSFDKIKLTFIREIYIGPKCRVEEKDIKLLLSTFGYDISNIKIKRSTASYR